MRFFKVLWSNIDRRIIAIAAFVQLFIGMALLLFGINALGAFVPAAILFIFVIVFTIIEMRSTKWLSKSDRT